MKLLTFALVGAVSFGVAATQRDLPARVADHVATLQQAPALTAKFTVQEVPGAPKPYTLTFAKPNLLKLETPDGFVLADGKSVYTYTTATNSYMQAEETDASLSAAVLAESTWAWSAFFAPKDFAKSVKSAQVGGKRNLKGATVTEVAVTLDGGATATLYLDDTLKFARGANIKTEKKELLIVATEISVPKSAPGADAFVFQAPAGATKVEKPVAPAATFTSVKAILAQKCMPCHAGGGRKNLKDGPTILSLVTPGDPDNSELMLYILGKNRPRMPRGRAPLSDTETSTISEWIKNGAKDD